MIRTIPIFLTLSVAAFLFFLNRGPRFVAIEPGEFQQGESDMKEINHDHPYSVKIKGNETWAEKPKHWVKLTQGFEIGVTEVTLGEFRTFVKATGYVTDAEKNGNGTGFDAAGGTAPKWMVIDERFDWQNPGFEQEENHPVVCVSWNDAQAYCKWRSEKESRTYRLPTEAEWEYAARAGTQTWYSWGDRPDDAYQFANVADSSLERAFPETTYYQRSYGLDSDGCSDGFVFTAPVGSLKPNPWELHDMHGNVWEWCEDIWQEDYYEILLQDYEREEKERVRITDPKGPETTEQQKHGNWRVLRGGSWYTGPISTRSAMRAFAEAGDGMCYAGFRVVREK